MAATSASADRPSSSFVDKTVKNNRNGTGEANEGLRERSIDKSPGQPGNPASKGLAEEQLSKGRTASSNVNGQSPFPTYGLVELEADARNVQSVQEKALQETLKLHENTEYLQKYGINGSTSVAEFRRRHPVTSYEDYAEYIEREVAGESRETGKQILCAEPIVGYMLTSGSSKGTQKKIPRTAGATLRNGMPMNLFKEIMQKHYGDKPQVILTFVHVGRVTPLPGGLTAGSGTTLGLRDILNNFETSPLAKTPSPKGVFATTDARQAMYCHLLCGLAGRERVTALRANFLIHVVAGVQFLEKHWRSFVSDLRNGTVNSDIVTDSGLRTAVEERVRAQHENASALEAEFRRGFEGIVPRVFPVVDSVQAVCTGGMLQYVPLMEKYAGPSVQLLTPFYAASEPSTIGFCLDLNTHPRDVAYTIIPRPVFWEFIPVDQPEGDEPVTKLLHELEEGRSYELVLTNVSGLYRYRLEDVVKVTGFWHGLPQVQYEYRRGTLTITAQSEKVTEKDLAVAIGEMEKSLPKESGRVLDYTVAIDTQADPERYSVFVEVDGIEGTVTEEALAACAYAFDSSLRKNPDYVHYRLRAQIGPAEICLVKGGTFDEFKAWKVGRGTDTAQYKVPRCLKTPEQQAIFRRGLLRSSAKDCHWFTISE